MILRKGSYRRCLNPPCRRQTRARYLIRSSRIWQPAWHRKFDLCRYGRTSNSNSVITTRLVPANPESISEAAELICAGQLVAFPTETVYGLGAHALNATAVYKIFAAKGRPSTDPLIVHIIGAEQLRQVATDIPERAYQLIEAFWPGPLTLILPRHPNVPAVISAELPTIAVRAPDHPVAEALISAANVPIAAPSANRFAHASPTTAKHVYDDLAGRVPLILDGGPTKIGVESTIVDMTGPHPKLLRPGAVSLSALSAIVPDVELYTRYLPADGGPQRAPGQLMMHYAPMAELFLFEGEPDAVRSSLRQAVAEHVRHGRHPGLLIATEDQAMLNGIDVPIEITGPLTDLDQVAKRLFAGLRALDSRKVDVILARGYPTQGIGLAIRDRLIRAAAGRTIRCA